MRRLGIWITAVALLAPLQACGTQYSAEAITAHVVDAETGKPLEGVIVVAHWQLYGGLHPDRVGELTIMETSTDKDGRFHFPAWGPKPIPAGMPSNARLTYLDPEMLLFKSGFKYQRISNKLTTTALSGEGSYLRRSDWNGTTIKLTPAVNDQEGRVRSLDSISSDLGFAIGESKTCDWRQIPMMVKEARRERIALEDMQITLVFRTPDERIRSSAQYFEKHGCANATQWLAETLK